MEQANKKFALRDACIVKQARLATKENISSKKLTYTNNQK